MKRLELDEATGPLAEYVHKIREEPLLLTRRGRPVAALLSFEGGDLETALLAADPQFQALLARSRESLRREGGLSTEEVRRILAEEGL